MATIASARIIDVHQARLIPQLDAVFKIATNQISAILINAAGGKDQKIPAAQRTAVREQASKAVLSVFLAQDKAFASDGVTPLAPFPRLLNQEIVTVSAEIVATHTRMLRKTVPKDIQDLLKIRTRFVKNTVSTQEVFSPLYAALRIFAVNPLAQYEPAHTWVDPAGYRLSDRIWNTGYRTRARIDQLLNDGINNGTSALRLSRQVEQFLLPSRAPLRTNRPYGTDASFDAMRLARTEIQRAAANASLIAGQQNPYVSGMDFALSPSHPKVDICDPLASIGVGGGRIKAAYPFGAVPVPVQDTHPQCLCRLQPYTDRASFPRVTQLWRDAMQDSLSNNVYASPTPLAGYDFMLWLLGTCLLYTSPSPRD